MVKILTQLLLDGSYCWKYSFVLVNYGHAKGKEILDFANLIKEKIKAAYNITLEIEVTIL